MLRLGTAFAVKSALALALLLLVPRALLAQPNETTRPALQVVGSCPALEAVESALAPLLKRDFSFPAEARPRVVDQGTRFTVSVKGQTGQYADSERDCAERARVSAVFIALTMNPPEIQSAESDTSPAKPSPPRAQLALTPAPVAAVAPHALGTWTALELGARFDGSLSADVPSTLAAGLELRASLGVGHAGGVLGASVLAPVVWDLSGVLVQEQRFPCHLALRLRWQTTRPSFSLDLGVSATVFAVRAPELDASSSARLDIGPRAALAAHFETLGALSPYLGAHFEYFPQTYRLYADPSGQIGATPHVWVGINVGASFAPN